MQSKPLPRFALLAGTSAEAIGRVTLDAFFLGVTGVHPVAGLTTGDADEAAVKRAWVRRAADTYVLGSGEKIGTASPFEVVPLSAVTAVLTDGGAPERGVRELREAGVDVRQP